jgi:hypothetical protein
MIKKAEKYILENIKNTEDITEKTEIFWTLAKL